MLMLSSINGLCAKGHLLRMSCSAPATVSIALLCLMVRMCVCVRARMCACMWVARPIVTGKCRERDANVLILLPLPKRASDGKTTSSAEAHPKDSSDGQ